jgi:hypothetical protein
MSQTFVPRSSETAASQVALPLILDLIGPVASVVQVGSGGGEWLDEASRLGVVDVRGIEGSLSFDRTYDLAVCIGVAEHLPHERAASFVADLGRLAPVVAFAAAIPGEGGRNNVNEQWPRYWERHFAAIRFRFIDPLRLELWHRSDVPAYVAQNLFLAVDERRLTVHRRLAQIARDNPGPVLSLVHPDVYMDKVEPGENAPVGVKGATRALVEALGRRARESRPLG